jgi:hypothetical protein
MKTQKYEARAGDTIQSTCEVTVEIARNQSCNVEFDFNGIKLVATPTTDPAVLAKSYSDECERRRQEYIASPEYKAQQEAYEQKERERKDKVSSLLASAPANMTLRDPESWKKANEANPDGYGGAIMTYAERWARLMEARMAKGERIAEIASECSHLADEEGITGFMYGAAVSVLAGVWVHGEALRLWHNLKTQIKDEGQKANDSGGVLNPAVISIG